MQGSARIPAKEGGTDPHRLLRFGSSRGSSSLESYDCEVSEVGKEARYVLGDALEDELGRESLAGGFGESGPATIIGPAVGLGKCSGS